MKITSKTSKKYIIRKTIIWVLILVICVPNIIVGEVGLKIFGVALFIVLVWWDHIATRKKVYKAHSSKKEMLSRSISTTKDPTFHDMKIKKQNIDNLLEQKPLWRLLKVLYIFVSIILTLAFSIGVGTDNSCEYGLKVVDKVSASMAQNRADWERANNPDCVSYSVFFEQVIPMVLVLLLSVLFFYVLYIGIKKLTGYIVWGSQKEGADQ